MTTLPTNTEGELPIERSLTGGQTLSRIENVTPVDLQVEELQGRLEKSEDARKEERFLWFCVSRTLLVSLIFVGAGVAAGSFASFIFLAMILVLSRRWGFDDLWEALNDAKRLLKSEPPKDD